MKFGRRTLLKFASLAVVSAHPKAFASEPTSALYDVIIVGGGGAGLSAAAHLAAGGKRVLLLEKTKEIGGSTKIASGQWAASGTKLQKLLEIEDSEELFVKDMMDVGEGFNPG